MSKEQNFDLAQFVEKMREYDWPKGAGHIIVNGVDITDRLVKNESVYMSDDR